MVKSLYDMTNTFTSKLEQISQTLPPIIKALQQGDQKLQQAQQNLTDYQLSFAGLGADAFVKSVMTNIGRASLLQTKLEDFGLAADNAKKTIDYNNDLYEPDLNMPLNSGQYDVWNTAFWTFGYDSVLDAVKYMKAGGIQYATLGAVIDLGDSVILDNHEASKGDFLVELKKRYDEYKTDGLDAYQMDNIKDDYSTCQQAISFIWKQQHGAFKNWVGAIQAAVSVFSTEVDAATQLDTLTMGDLMMQMYNPQAANASVIIWQTPDGGLIVLVKDGKGSPTQVAQAINNYRRQYHLGAGTQVTIVGYKQGGDIAAQVADASNQQGSPFHVENVVLIGAKAPTDPNPGTNYDIYSFSGDPNTSRKGVSAVPHTGAEWEQKGFEAGSELLIGGPEAIPGIVVANTVGVADESLNNYMEVRYANAKEQTINMDPEHHYVFGGISSQNGTNSAQQNSQLHLTYDRIGIVPDSPGAHMPGSGTNYNQSAWFDTQGVPDPTKTSQIPTGQIGSVPDQSPVPISGPKYYTF